MKKQKRSPFSLVVEDDVKKSLEDVQSVEMLRTIDAINYWVKVTFNNGRTIQGIYSLPTLEHPKPEIHLVDDGQTIEQKLFGE